MALINFFSCEDRQSFEESVHLGRGALSDNYGMWLLPFNLLSIITPITFDSLLYSTKMLLNKNISVSVLFPRHMKWHFPALSIDTIDTLYQNCLLNYSWSYSEYLRTCRVCCHPHNYLRKSLKWKEKMV